MEKNGEFKPEKETTPQKKVQEVIKTAETKLEQYPTGPIPVKKDK